MTIAALCWQWELAEREAELPELLEHFPEIDWEKVQQLVEIDREARWAALRRDRAGEPALTLDQVSAVVRTVCAERIAACFDSSPLLGRLKR